MTFPIPRRVAMLLGVTAYLPLVALSVPAPLLGAFPARADGPNCTEELCARWSEPTGTVCRIAGSGARVGGLENGARFLIDRDILDAETEVDRERPDGCFTASRPYALQGFVLSMGNHSVDRLHILQGPGTFDIGIRDGDGGDVASGVVWATPIPRNTDIRIISFRCHFECIFDVREHLPPDDLPDGRPVFMGFDLNRVGDSGGHLAELSIEMLSDAHLLVRFGERDWVFDATVQVGWVDRRAVAGGSFSSLMVYDGHAEEERPAAPDQVHPALLYRRVVSPYDHALRQFTAIFTNGGHFLGHIGIERDRGLYEAWMQDEQSPENLRFPDDPFVMAARHVSILPFLDHPNAVIEFGPVFFME